MTVHFPLSEDELSEKVQVWLIILSNSNLLAQHPDIEGNCFVVLNTILQMTCDIFAPIDVLLSMKSLEAKEQHVFSNMLMAYISFLVLAILNIHFLVNSFALTPALIQWL